MSNGKRFVDKKPSFIDTLSAKIIAMGIITGVIGGGIAFANEFREVAGLVYANECLSIQKSLDYYNQLKAGYLSRSEQVPTHVQKSINDLINKKQKYNCP